MKKEYWECSKQKCKWIGTDEEKGKIPDKHFPTFAETLVCPECGCESFYAVEGKQLEKHLAVKDRPIIPTDEEIDSVWGNASFGEMERIDVVKMGVLKCASGYYQGYTSRCIVQELGLVTKSDNLTRRGKKCLWEWFNDGTNF